MSAIRSGSVWRRSSTAGRTKRFTSFARMPTTTRGCSSATARRDVSDNIPAVHVVVLMETGREGELKAVQDVLTASNRCRGPQRFPIVVIKGVRRFVYIDLQFALSPGWLEDPVALAIKTA